MKCSSLLHYLINVYVENNGFGGDAVDELSSDCVGAIGQIIPEVVLAQTGCHINLKTHHNLAC